MSTFDAKTIDERVESALEGNLFYDDMDVNTFVCELREETSQAQRKKLMDNIEDRVHNIVMSLVDGGTEFKDDKDVPHLGDLHDTVYGAYEQFEQLEEYLMENEKLEDFKQFRAMVAKSLADKVANPIAEMIRNADAAEGGGSKRRRDSICDEDDKEDKEDEDDEDDEEIVLPSPPKFQRARNH